jgi:hypothetical protein
MGPPPNIDGLLRGLELEFGPETWKLSSADQDLQFDTTFGSIFHLEVVDPECRFGYRTVWSFSKMSRHFLQNDKTE